MKKNNPKETLSVIWKVSKIGSFAFLLSIIGSIIFSLGNYGLVYLAGRVTEEAIGQASLGVFKQSPFITLGVLFILITPLLTLAQIINLTGGQVAEKKLKKIMVQQMLRQKEAEIKKSHSGDMMTLLTNDADVINNFYFQGVNYMFLHPLASGLAALITLLIIDYRFALIALGIGVASVVISGQYSSRIQDKYIKVREAQNSATTKLSEILSNEEVIRLNNLETLMIHEYDHKNIKYSNEAVDAENLKHKVTLWNDSFNQLLKLSFLILGIVLASKNEFNFTKIMLILMLQPNISTMFGSLSQSWNFLLEIATSAQRIVNMLDTETENERQSLGEITPIETMVEGKIDFDEVSFGYTDSNLIIDNLTLHIPAKKTIAFVGESGSGKSTLFQLLLGFYDLQRGAIKLDEKNVEKFNLDSIRRQMIYVQQESPLFNISIKENIRLGSHDYNNVTDEQIIEASKKAAIHEFILSLPEGYDTIVGENASRISGGQRQRIAIARAFISDSPILIMDEPTSALDSESESLIQVALANIRKQKTVLIAAHRLSTIKDADTIVVLEKGKIAEQGNHEDLMYNKKEYYNYVKTLE